MSEDCEQAKDVSLSKPNRQPNVIKVEKEVIVPPPDYLPMKKRLAFLEGEVKKFEDLIYNCTSPPMRKMVVDFQKRTRIDLEVMIDDFAISGYNHEEEALMKELIDYLKEVVSELEKIADS